MANTEYIVTGSSGVEISRAHPFTLLSPVPHLLRVPNVASTSSETFNIDNIVEESDRHLSQFAQSISALQSEIDRLEAESELVQVFKHHHLAMKSPIHRCPPEVMSEIFLSCLPCSPSGESHTVPLLLSHICKRFRAVAIRTPALWASVYMNTDNHPHRAHQAISTTWIKRSASHPLHVTIVDIDCILIEDEVLSQLLSSSPRWKSVKIQVFQQEVMCEYFSSLKGAALPQLEHASIAWRSTGLEPASLDCFEHAKQLHSVEIWNFESLTLSMPWGQLTRLNCVSGDVVACVSLLPKLSCLLTWSCSFHWRGDFTLSSQHVSNTRLRTLMIHASNKQVYHAFFDTTSLQGLQQLWVNGVNLYVDVLDWSVNLHTSALAFLTKSGCKLRTLGIVNVQISVTQIAELIDSMPTLVDLHLGVQGNDVLVSSLTDLLHFRPGRTVVGPNIKHLTLHGSTNYESVRSLISMIHSRLHRNEAVKPTILALESVTFCTFSCFPTSAIAQLRELEIVSLVGLKVAVQKPRQSVFPPGEWDNPIDVDLS